ncbi:MAG TPA: hypothetical protein VMT76_06880 [Puia sp.]|nr:hypothetical protein [Puia sp.]
MKKLMIVLVLLFSARVNAQSYELERLILDIEKLAQLKDILSDLYKGYEILNNGYNTIKNISQGNFNLHQAFLDGLLLVSPAVKNYRHVADIIGYQARIVSEYKSAFNVFRQDKHFSPAEISYLSNVYNNLVSGSLANLANLLNVLTDKVMRMSDDERLHAIDEIYVDTKDKYLFLRQFNNSTTILAVQRSVDENDAGTIKKLYPLAP